jgi:DNA-binding transcriptional LysR family regulator
VARLGEAVGRPLFEQIGRQVHLTAEGRRLHACAGELFEALERFQAEMADMEGLKRGRLRLAVVTTAEYFAPRVLGAFSRKYPGIEGTGGANRRRVLERVAANDDDCISLASLPGPGGDGGAVPAEPARPWPGRPRPGRAHSRAPGPFRPEPMIMRERGSGTAQGHGGAFPRGRAEPAGQDGAGRHRGHQAGRGRRPGGHGPLGPRLEPFGRGPAFLHPGRGRLSLRPQWRLVRPRGKALSPAARAFRAFVLEAGPALVGPLPVAGPLCLPSPTGRQGRGGEADEI